MVLLEGGDADSLAEGEEVTLKNWGNVKIKRVEKDDAGERRLLADFQDSLSSALHIPIHHCRPLVRATPFLDFSS